MEMANRATIGRLPNPNRPGTAKAARSMGRRVLARVLFLVQIRVLRKMEVRRSNQTVRAPRPRGRRLTIIRRIALRRGRRYTTIRTMVLAARITHGAPAMGGVYINSSLETGTT